MRAVKPERFRAWQEKMLVLRPSAGSAGQDLQGVWGGDVTPCWTNGMATLYQSDARALPLPDKSVHCCVTSPPYWGLRDYGVEGGIGLEPTLGEWVANIVAVGREVWRVLRDDGSFWLNLGDAYTGSGKGHSNDVNPGISKSFTRNGDTRQAVGHDDLPPKNLMGQPWRVAFALQDDGWILRQCHCVAQAKPDAGERH